MNFIDLIVFLPLIAAIFSYAGKFYFGDYGAQLITSASMILVAVLSWIVFLGFLSDYESGVLTIAQWGAAGDFIF